MNIALWIVQGLLAAMFAMAGQAKTFTPAKVRADARMTWAQDKTDGYIRFIGVAELLGAIGLILPLITGIFPWLTVLAAIGLGLIQALAIFTVHLPKKEYQVIPVNILLLAFAVFIAFGRFNLFS